MLSVRGELRHDFSGLGEAAELLLGKNQDAVHDDIEYAAAALDDGRFDGARMLQLGRQTGGAG